jgi:hypothetical protein
MAGSFLTLLLALALCYGLFKVCRAYSESLGQFLCAATGIAMLLAHSFSGTF